MNLTLGLLLVLGFRAFAQAPSLLPVHVSDLPTSAPATVQGVPSFAQGFDNYRRRLGNAGLSAEEIDRVFETAQLIQKKYIKRLDEGALLDRAVRGAQDNDAGGSRLYSALKAMASGIDPYTYFMTPDEYARFSAYFEGTSATNGLLLGGKEPGRPLKVLETYPDGPADNAGIQAGDEIVAIEGRRVEGLSDDDIDKIYPEGGAGTLTHLQVRRGGVEFGVALARVEITMADIYCAMIAPGVGYLQIRGFHNETDAHLKKALAALSAQGMSQLVIDLRDNPGGRINSTIRAASVFLRARDVVVRMEEGGQTGVVTAPEDGAFKDLPLAILVDGNSASASEIFAGAMRDNGRASLIGERTYGKGIGQDTTEFSDHSALKITCLRVFNPSGRSVQGRGLDPDIPVRTSAADKLQIERRLYRQISGQAVDGAMDPVLAAAFRR